MSAQPVADAAEEAAVVLSGAVLEAVAALGAGADARLAASWGWEARTKALASLDRAVEMLGVYRSRVLAAQKADGRWARSGDRSFEAWRGRTSRTGVGAARAEAELAECLAALPEAAEAVSKGAVSMEHARVLTRLRTRSSPVVQRALENGGAAHLLAVAVRQRMDASGFARQAQAWAAALDEEAAEASFEAVRGRRYARVIDRDGGTRLDAFVDPVAGATVRTALEALTTAPSSTDERTREQRMADALTMLAGRVLDGGLDKTGAQIRPHLCVLVPADTWTSTRRRRRLARDAAAGEDADGEGPQGEGVASVAGSGVAMVAELDDGTAIPPTELERLACDCEPTRLVLDAEGIPLDVGQTRRTYAKGLRRAVLVRHGCCQWPGCTLRASWCEVHHVRWYSRGGATSLGNGLALCVFHHHEVHRRGVQITSVHGGTRFTRPDGTLIGTATRHGGARRLLPSPSPSPSPSSGPSPSPGPSPRRPAERAVDGADPARSESSARTTMAERGDPRQRESMKPRPPDARAPGPPTQPASMPQQDAAVLFTADDGAPGTGRDAP